MSIASAQVVRQTGWTPLPLFAYKHAARWQVSVLQSQWFYWPTIKLQKKGPLKCEGPLLAEREGFEPSRA